MPFSKIGPSAKTFEKTTALRIMYRRDKEEQGQIAELGFACLQNKMYITDNRAPTRATALYTPSWE